jgi:hypothetical protein
MAALKTIYRGLYQLLNSLVLMFSVYSLGYSLDDKLQWLCLSFIALTPLAQLIAPYDRQPPNTLKIKLPLVSLLVMLAIGLLLLVASQGLALWLGLACLGGFLINNSLADRALAIKTVIVSFILYYKDYSSFPNRLM